MAHHYRPIKTVYAGLCPSADLITAPFADGFAHGNPVGGFGVVGNLVAGADGDAAVAFDFRQQVADLLLHFSRRFKLLMGSTPAAYRARLSGI